MSQRQFDDLTRALAKGASRRDLLKIILGGLGSLIAAIFVTRLEYPTPVDAAEVTGTTTTTTTTGLPCPACGPCQSCQYDAAQGKYRCIDTCGPCGRCKKVNGENICLRKCPFCSDCVVNSHNIGVCIGRCQTCEACVVPDGYDVYEYGEPLDDPAKTKFCVSRCGPGRTCQNNQCLAVKP